MSVSLQSRFGSDAPYVNRDFSEIWDMMNPESETNAHQDRLSYINSCIDDHFQGLFSKLRLVTKITKEQEIFDNALRAKIESVKKEIYHTKFYLADFFKNLDEIAIEQVYDELELPI